MRAIAQPVKTMSGSTVGSFSTVGVAVVQLVELIVAGLSFDKTLKPQVVAVL